MNQLSKINLSRKYYAIYFVISLLTMVSVYGEKSHDKNVVIIRFYFSFVDFC